MTTAHNTHPAATPADDAVVLRPANIERRPDAPPSRRARQLSPDHLEPRPRGRARRRDRRRPRRPHRPLDRRSVPADRRSRRPAPGSRDAPAPRGAGPPSQRADPPPARAFRGLEKWQGSRAHAGARDPAPLFLSARLGRRERARPGSELELARSQCSPAALARHRRGHVPAAADVADQRRRPVRRAVRVAPAHQRDQDGQQVTARGREHVLVALRALLVEAALQDPVVDEPRRAASEGRCARCPAWPGSRRSGACRRAPRAARAASSARPRPRACARSSTSAPS